MEIALVAALCISILLAAQRIYSGLRGHATVMFEAVLRSGFVANFSRFGDYSEFQIAVIDDKRGYFVRDGALWMVDVVAEGDDGYNLVKESARPVDLMKVDSSLLKEVMAAVDTLHDDYDDLREEE